MWHAEYCRTADDGSMEDWIRIEGGPFRTQEKAKGECKKVLLAEPQNRHRLHFRTVANDDRGTIYQVSTPPHGDRLRWVDSIHS